MWRIIDGADCGRIDMKENKREERIRVLKKLRLPEGHGDKELRSGEGSREGQLLTTHQVL
jgi:hypothetical protein